MKTFAFGLLFLVMLVTALLLSSFTTSADKVAGWTWDSRIVGE